VLDAEAATNDLLKSAASMPADYEAKLTEQTKEAIVANKQSSTD